MLQQPKKIMPLLAKPEREAMRVACRFNARLLDYLREFIRPGITTGEIDKLVYDYTVKHGHRPAPLRYQGYPRSCCTSITK